MRTLTRRGSTRYDGLPEASAGYKEAVWTAQHWSGSYAIF